MKKYKTNQARKLRFTFNKTSKTYQAARKDYPKQLVADIIDLSRIDENSSILDIGCGTGKSTLPFVRTGASIVGIDISKNMINEARKLALGYPNVRYKNVSVEKAIFPRESLDLVICGTAFHWLKRDIVYGKVNRLLKKGGHLAIFWSTNTKRMVKFVSEANRIFLRDAPDYRKLHKFFDGIEGTYAGEIRNSGMFKNIKVKKYREIERYTKEQYLKTIGTRSYIISLNEKQRRVLSRDLTALFFRHRFPVAIPREYTQIIAEKI